MTKTTFREVNIGQRFYFASFGTLAGMDSPAIDRPYVKVSTRTYRDVTSGDKYAVGSVRATAWIA